MLFKVSERAMWFCSATFIFRVVKKTLRKLGCIMPRLHNSFRQKCVKVVPRGHDSLVQKYVKVVSCWHDFIAILPKGVVPMWYDLNATLIFIPSFLHATMGTLCRTLPPTQKTSEWLNDHGFLHCIEYTKSITRAIFVGKFFKKIVWRLCSRVVGIVTL